jgi:hypothetical protein
MVKSILILTLFFNFSGLEPDIPLLSMQSFEYVLDYNFKNKPSPDVDYLKKNPAYKTHPLPYVKMTFIVDGEVHNFFRYKVINNFNLTIKNKRFKGLEQIELDIGFTEDIKDRITAHSYSIIFYNDDKKAISMILINFTEEGDMYINENLLGKI